MKQFIIITVYIVATDIRTTMTMIVIITTTGGIITTGRIIPTGRTVPTGRIVLAPSQVDQVLNLYTVEAWAVPPECREVVVALAVAVVAVVAVAVVAVARFGLAQILRIQNSQLRYSTLNTAPTGAIHE